MTFLFAVLAILAVEYVPYFIRFVLERMRGYPTGGFAVIDDLDWVWSMCVLPLTALVATIVVTVFGSWWEVLLALIFLIYPTFSLAPRFLENKEYVLEILERVKNTPLREWAD